MNKQFKVLTLRPLPSIRLWSRYVLAPAVLTGWLTGIPAEAATVNVSLTFDHDYGRQLVNQANPVTDVFNLAPFLSTDIVVTSAAIEFQFTDNHDPLTVTSTDVTPYSYRNTTTTLRPSGFFEDYNETAHYYRDSTIQQINPAESARLSIGAINYNAATISIGSRNLMGQTSDGTTFLGSHNTSPGCRLFCSTTYEYRADHTDQYVRTTGYSGRMSIAATLDPLALGNLTQDGVVPFTVTAADGDFLFNTARLTVFVESVPIPASVWLFGSGLLGLIGVARRKTRTAQQRIDV